MPIINFDKAFVFAVAFDYVKIITFALSFNLALAFHYAKIIDYTKACNYVFDYAKLIAKYDYVRLLRIPLGPLLGQHQPDKRQCHSKLPPFSQHGQHMALLHLKGSRLS